MPKTIKLTQKQTSLIKDAAGWTPFCFETNNHGIVYIPGPNDDDEGWEDFYEEVASRLEDSLDTYPCGCCECCGCDCWCRADEGSWQYGDEEEDE